MRTYTTTHTVYTFDELSESAKQKAIEKLWNINVDYEWWDYLLDNWKEKLEKLGFLNAKIYFSGFSSQGDGACFDADIDLQTISNNMFYCSTDYKTACLWRAINIAVYTDRIDSPKIYTVDHHYNHENTRAIDTGYCGLQDTIMTDKLMQMIEDLNEYRRDICQEIYSDLQEEYDYLTSEESIIETIRANEYEFDENGDLV